MASASKKRKSKHRMKNTGAFDRYYLGAKTKDYRYGMYNSSLRMSLKANLIANEI